MNTTANNKIRPSVYVFGCGRGGQHFFESMPPITDFEPISQAAQILVVDPARGKAEALAAKCRGSLENIVPVCASYQEVAGSIISDSFVVSLTDDIAVLGHSLSDHDSMVRHGQINLLIPTDQMRVMTGFQVTLIPGDHETWSQSSLLLDYLNAAVTLKRSHLQDFQQQKNLGDLMVAPIRQQLTRQTLANISLVHYGYSRHPALKPLTLYHNGRMQSLVVFQSDEEKYSRILQASLEAVKAGSAWCTGETDWAVLAVSLKTKHLTAIFLHYMRDSSPVVRGIFRYNPDTAERVSTLRRLATVAVPDVNRLFLVTD